MPSKWSRPVAALGIVAILLLLLTGVPGVTLAAALAEKVVATIPVGGNPSAAAYDPLDGDLLVSTSGDRLVVISSATNTVVTEVRLQANPLTPAVDTANGYVYVPNYGSGTVSVINGSTDSLLANVTVGAYPSWLMFVPTTSDLYLTYDPPDSNNITIIHGSTHQLVVTLRTSAPVTGLLYDPSNGDLYAPQPSLDDVQVYSGSTDQSLGSIRFGFAASQMSYDTANGTLYVLGASAGATELAVVSAANNSVVSTTTIFRSIGVTASPGTPTFDSVDNDLYVPLVEEECVASGQLTECGPVNANVTVVSATTDTVVASVTVGSDPARPVYDSGDGDLYVADPYQCAVSVINGSTNSLAATITVGSAPDPPAYAPDSGELYVSDLGSGNVMVLGAGSGTPSTSTPGCPVAPLFGGPAVWAIVAVCVAVGAVVLVLALRGRPLFH